MNVDQLQSPSASQLQRVSSETSEKDANFLSFKLLNKRARVRLSPEPLDLQQLPGKAQLFCTANLKGWFVAVIRTSQGTSLIFSLLSELRAAFSSTSENEEIPFTPQRRLSLESATPNLLAFALNDSRLIVGLTQGSIAVFDTSSLFTRGSEPIPPLRTFDSTALVQILPNPGDMPELVAILREADPSAPSPTVEILNVQSLQSVGGWRCGNTPDTTPASLSWSPRGKQLALGLRSGDIVTFSPTTTSTTKSHIPSPLGVPGQGVIGVTWLSNPSFHVIYAPPGPLIPDVEQSHYIVSFDSKAGTVSNAKLNAPYLPFPGLRPPSSFTVVLRSWEPAKFLILVGDSSSSDIGAIGCFSERESWHNLSLEETSTPSMPLDKEMNDTVLTGLELDLTSSQPLRNTGSSGEEIEHPPPPIMYAYASDGTILGWHILNTQGKAYPGMITESAATATAPAIPPATGTSTFGSLQVSTAPTTFGTPSQSSAMSITPISSGAFGQSSTPAFGQSAFSNQPTSGFGQPSAFGSQQSSSLFGGQPSAPRGAVSAFGSPAFGQTSQPASAFSPGTPSTTEAFGAFASGGPSKFSTSTGFGFGSSPSPPTPPSAPTPAEEDSMNSESTTPAFGGLSLGGDSSSTPEPSSFGSGTAGMFGQSAFSTPNITSPSPAFGSSGFGSIKPATGFGAFSNISSQSASPTPSSNSSETTKTSTAFGKTGFEAKPVSGFGQSSFGQSSFGQPSVGFGATPKPVATPATTTVGGFGAFAQGGAASFGFALKGASDGKPASGGNESGTTTEQPKSVFGGGFSGTSAFAQNKSTEQPKSVFGGGGAFGGSVFANSSTESASIPSSTTPEPPKPGFGAFGGSSFSQSTTATNAFGGPTFGGDSPTSDESRSPSSDKSPSPPPFLKPAVSSPFQSSAPALGTGAFGSLQSSSVGFSKPAEGFGAFGAFGGDTQASPFFNPKPAEQKPVSVFGSTTPATTPTKSPATTPTFGSSSTLGAKTVFSTPSSAPPAKISAPTTGGFGAFSGTSGGFASFAGTGKSFSDLLKTGEDAKDPSKPIATPSSSQVQDKLKPVSVFGSLASSQKEPNEKKESEATQNITTSQELLSQGPSLSSISASSASSSFVEVSASDEEKDSASVTEKEPEEVSESDDLEEENTVGDESFLTDSQESDPDYVPESEHEESEEEEEEEEEGSIPEEPLESVPATPAKRIRATSTTPKDDPPMINVKMPSPPATPSPLEATKPMFARAGSTTPPGSPGEGSTVPPRAKSPIPAPAPVPAAANQPFTLGIGRPSTRPARSSPLASAAPLSRPEEESPPPPKSAPPKLHPASPKHVFGTWAPPVKPEPSGETRAKTPPLLFGGIQLGASAAPPPLPGLFGKKPTTPLPASTFDLSGGLTLPPIPPPAVPFGKAPTPFPTVTPTISASLFGGPSTPAPFASPGPLLGAKHVIPPTAPPVSAPVPAPSIEQGMQSECMYLFTTLAKELEELRLLSAHAKEKRENMAKPSGGLRHKADLTEPSKWTSMSDVAEHGRVMKELDGEVEAMSNERAGLTRSVRDLEGLMLKAGTRKEEITRFDKARGDADFARMLKVRTLGPETLETQSQLRRDIRLMRDRVETLEDHLRASKKKLNASKTGKPTLKAPSLDTVNRTLRNIDLAIDHQSSSVSDLTSRVFSLDLSHPGAPARDKRLPDAPHAPLGITPHVAHTTAAALNAERSAQRLKRALMTVRKEPGLNTGAGTARAAPIVFSTPGKTAVKQEPGTSSPFGLLGGIKQEPGTPPALSWSPAGFESESPSPGGRLRAGGGTKHHSKPVPLRKSASPSVGSPSFDWGPLPGVTPIKMLSADVRPIR